MNTKYNPSYVSQYILNELFSDHDINIEVISNKFGYKDTSVYKILRKINSNFVKMKAGKYISKRTSKIYYLYKKP